MEERRRFTRWAPASTEALSRVRLRAGRELAVVNISSSGALLDGLARLLPGTNVDVHVTAAQGRVLVRARVIRCAVWQVTADVIFYRGALAFSADVDLPSIARATGDTTTTGPQTDATPHQLVEPASSGLP
jgi:hypothetical protein